MGFRARFVGEKKLVERGEGGVDVRGESETRGGKIRATKKKKKKERKRRNHRVNTCTTDATVL